MQKIIPPKKLLIVILLSFVTMVSAEETNSKEKYCTINPVNKIGFQLVFNELDLNSHTREFGLSYYPTTNLEMIIHCMIFKENINFHYSIGQGNNDSTLNRIEVHAGFKKHLSHRNRISPFYGIMIAGNIPWRYRHDSMPYRNDSDIFYYNNYDVYRIQLGLNIPIGITWWIKRCITIEVSNQIGVIYDYESIKRVYDYHYPRIPQLYKNYQSTTWEYGLIDFKFICSFYYDL